MKNPRLHFKIDGKEPPNYPALGYSIPFKYELIMGLIKEYTDEKEWSTIQIKIMPSLLSQQTKLLIISTEYKHIDVPVDHMVMMFEEKTRKLIASASTLEDIFELFDEKYELKE